MFISTVKNSNIILNPLKNAKNLSYINRYEAYVRY